MLDIKSKIEKLLALAGNNPDEKEAASALLKAQQLMQEYDIQEDALGNKKEYTYINKVVVTGSESWRYSLGNIIANNFKSKFYVSNKNPAFFGREQHVNNSVVTFEYTYKYIVKRSHHFYNEARKNGKNTNKVMNTYAMGFISGIKAAFDQQCTALMIITPPETEKAFTSYLNEFEGKTKKTSIKYQENNKVFEKAYREGKEMFDRKSLTA